MTDLYCCLHLWLILLLWILMLAYILLTNSIWMAVISDWIYNAIWGWVDINGWWIIHLMKWYYCCHKHYYVHRLLFILVNIVPRLFSWRYLLGYHYYLWNIPLNTWHSTDTYCCTFALNYYSMIIKAHDLLFLLS